jgi:hypothetical protein
MEYKTIGNHRGKNATGQSAVDQKGLEEAVRDRVIAGGKEGEEGENIE